MKYSDIYILLLKHVGCGVNHLPLDESSFIASNVFWVQCWLVYDFAIMNWCSILSYAALVHVHS